MLKWLVLALALVEVPPADACSCADGNGFDLPASGATDVPPNIKALYESSQSLDVLVNEVTGDEVALQTDSSQPERDAVTRYLVTSTLAPSTRYSIRDATGTAVRSFTTGEAADTTPPPTPTLAGFGIRKELGDGDCALSIIDVFGAMSLPEAAVLGARFSSPGGGEQAYHLEPGRGFGPLGGGCKVPFDAAADTDVTVTIWTEDLAGNRSAEVSASARVEGCGYGECQDEDQDEDQDDDGGCSTGGAGLGGLVGLLALRRRRLA